MKAAKRKRAAAAPARTAKRKSAAKAGRTDAPVARADEQVVAEATTDESAATEVDVGAVELAPEAVERVLTESESVAAIAAEHAVVESSPDVSASVAVEPAVSEVSTRPAESSMTEEVTEVAAAAAVASAAQPIVTLNSNCTVKDAAALKQSLCAVVASESAVTLDVSGLERIDTASIQVLCAFVRQRAADARAVIWQGVPAALREAAGLLGVRELLMLPDAGATT